jgi:hypothetical protein
VRDQECSLLFQPWNSKLTINIVEVNNDVWENELAQISFSKPPERYMAIKNL